MTETKNSGLHLVKQRCATRPRLWIALAGFVVLVPVAGLLAFALLHSMPQHTVTMAVYPEGTLNAALAKEYRDILARQGIELRLTPSPGAVEALEQMRDRKSPVSVAIVPGGVTTAEESPEVVSLGTLYYMPLWIFSRGTPAHRREPSRTRRIGVGLEGSSSRALTLKFLGPTGILNQQTILLAFAPAERAQALIDGETDTAVFLDSWTGPSVQLLLKRKDIVLRGVPHADALVALYPSLDRLIFPAGVVEMTEPRPADDVPLVATKTSLVVRKDLHPAIQYLLLEAAREIHSTPGIFHASARFPAAEAIDLPLSSYAIEFYRTGAPFLQRHLPFWLAVLLQEPLLWVIPLIALLLPSLRLVPAIYNWLERRRIYKLYSELKRLEDQMVFCDPAISRKAFLQQLDHLKDRASHLSVPTPFRPLVYSLRLHIDMVRQEAHRFFRRTVGPEPESTHATEMTVRQ